MVKDKKHSTNYRNTFIEVAEDCKVTAGTAPALRNDRKTVAFLQFELAAKNPYQLTSDDLLFLVHAERKDLTPAEYETAREEFFSKGQACLRASPLTKQFGWGVHFDDQGRIALYGMETGEYRRFVEDPAIRKVKAMRTSR